MVEQADEAEVLYSVVDGVAHVELNRPWTPS